MFELLHDQLPELGEQLALRGCELSRLAVDDAQRAQRVAFGRTQRRARIEADERVAHHERVVVEAHVFFRVAHLHDALAEDGVAAERGVAAGVRAAEADGRLEPLPLRVDERDERHRHVEEPGGETGEAVESCLRGRVEHREPPQRLEPLRFISGNRWGLHGAQHASLAARVARSCCNTVA